MCFFKLGYMSNKISKSKKIATGIGVGAVIGAGAIGLNMPASPDYLSLSEYQEFIEVINYEASISGGITLEGVDNTNVAQKLAEKLTEREIKEDKVVLDGKEYTKQQYKSHRDKFNKRFHPKVIDKILNKL
jgi:hypothetical protein